MRQSLHPLSRHLKDNQFEFEGSVSAFSVTNEEKSMRAEIQNVVDEIKQGLALLRRHL